MLLLTLDKSFYIYLANFITRGRVSKKLRLEARKIFLLIKTLYSLMLEAISCLVRLWQYRYCFFPKVIRDVIKSHHYWAFFQ